jgi:hypothetical protein
VTEADVDAASHIVAMMGVEPIQQAVAAGARVVIAGRSSDTSIFAALPLLEGFSPAVVWHMAKILECAAAAVTHRLAPDSMMAELHEDSFDVFPLRDDYRCTPQGLASSLLEGTGLQLSVPPQRARPCCTDQREVRSSGRDSAPQDKSRRVRLPIA